MTIWQEEHHRMLAEPCIRQVPNHWGLPEEEPAMLYEVHLPDRILTRTPDWDRALQVLGEWRCIGTDFRPYMPYTYHDSYTSR